MKKYHQTIGYQRAKELVTLLETRGELTKKEIMHLTQHDPKWRSSFEAKFAEAKKIARSKAFIENERRALAWCGTTNGATYQVVGSAEAAYNSSSFYYGVTETRCNHAVELVHTAGTPTIGSAKAHSIAAQFLESMVERVLADSTA